MWTHPASSAEHHQSDVADAFGTTFDEVLEDPSREGITDVAWEHVECAYCAGELERLDESGNRSFALEDGESVSLAELVVCQRCGWWAIVAGDFELDVEHESWYAKHTPTCWPRKYDRPLRGVARVRTVGVSGCLAKFDNPSDTLSMPVEELARYLLAKPDARFRVDPFKCQAVVADMLRNHGHTIIETARSRDGGIDLYLTEGPGRKTGAVQVKRYKGKVGVAIVREFRGALLEVPSVAKGIIVTTSSFTRGAMQLAQASRPVPIELVDGNRLLNMLGCNLRAAYSQDDIDTAAFAKQWASIESSLSEVHWSESDLPDEVISSMINAADAQAAGDEP